MAVLGGTTVQSKSTGQSTSTPSSSPSSRASMGGHGHRWSSPSLLDIHSPWAWSSRIRTTRLSPVVEEDVAFALENLGVPPAEIRRRVDEALKAVGRYEFREHAPTFSRADRSWRVAIAGRHRHGSPLHRAGQTLTAMLDLVGRREVLGPYRSSTRLSGGHCSPSSPTTWTRPPWPTVWWSCPRARWWLTALPGRSFSGWRAQGPGPHRPRDHRAALAAPGRTGWTCPWTP